MTKQTPYRRIIGFIGSSRFFWGVSALLALQAAWIAASGRYPMAFDEDFHLGIIRLYAHHISPFWGEQPPGADAFGAVARDPSYLYHYLMSFPYRLISAFTHDQTIQVLWLRALNIGLFVWGIGLYRRLLLKTGASRALVHGCLLIFVLIPVVPFLAAQINYDNLLLPLVALALLWTVDLAVGLGKRRIDVGLSARLAILCLLASLVKYAFLPIFAAIVIYLMVRARRGFGGWPALWSGLNAGLKRLGRRTGVLLGATLLVSALLFTQRYGVNLIRYHTPLPDCSQVLSAEDCSAYGPWLRDHILESNKRMTPHHPGIFLVDWFKGMWLRLFFAVDGPATHFQTRGPLLVPAIGSIGFAAVGVVLFGVYGRRVFRSYDTVVLNLFLLIAVLYVGALWFDGFQAYMRVGQPVAINGRYIFPILLPLLLISVLTWNELCRGRPRLKLFIGTVAVLCLLWGGGGLTYVLRGQPAWYWPNRSVRTVNRAIRTTVGPLVPGYRHPTEFLSLD